MHKNLVLQCVTRTPVLKATLVSQLHGALVAPFLSGGRYNGDDTWLS